MTRPMSRHAASICSLYPLSHQVATLNRERMAVRDLAPLIQAALELMITSVSTRIGKSLLELIQHRSVQPVVVIVGCSFSSWWFHTICIASPIHEVNQLRETNDKAISKLQSLSPVKYSQSDTGDIRDRHDLGIHHRVQFYLQLTM